MEAGAPLWLSAREETEGLQEGRRNAAIMATARWRGKGEVTQGFGPGTASLRLETCTGDPSRRQAPGLESLPGSRR